MGNQHFLNPLSRRAGRVSEMGDAVKKTISLPPDLAEDAGRVAKEEGKSLSAVIQDARRLSRRQRLSGEWPVFVLWTGRGLRR
jgi:hypothetical protein